MHKIINEPHNFIVVDTDSRDIHYISKTKANIDTLAVDFIKKNYDKKIEQKIYENADE